MPISMYQASAPRFANMLRNLATLIEKADAHCAAKKIDPAAITSFRLYPDMFPFTRQVQIACDTAKGAVARLAGVEMPKHEDTEQSFAELSSVSHTALAWTAKGDLALERGDDRAAGELFRRAAEALQENHF